MRDWATRFTPDFAAAPSGLRLLHDWPRTQFERPLRILHMGADDIQGERELAEAILGLPTRNLIRIA